MIAVLLQRLDGGSNCSILHILELIFISYEGDNTFAWWSIRDKRGKIRKLCNYFMACCSNKAWVEKKTFLRFTRLFCRTHHKLEHRHSSSDKQVHSFVHITNDMNPTTDHVHVPEGPITRSKVQKIQEAYTLHLQKLASVQVETKTYSRGLYIASSKASECTGWNKDFWAQKSL